MDDLKTLLSEKVRLQDDKKFLFFHDRHLTYRELDSLGNRFSRVFRELGVRKGDHVAVMLPNCPALRKRADKAVTVHADRAGSAPGFQLLSSVLKNITPFF